MDYRILLIAMLAALAFTSCGGDDDDPVLTPTQLLTSGIWTYAGEQEEDGSFIAVAADDCDFDDTVEFKTDGVFILDYNDDTLCNGVVDEIPETGTWSAADDRLRVNFDDDDTEVNRFTVTATELKVFDDEESGSQGAVIYRR